MSIVFWFFRLPNLNYFIGHIDHVDKRLIYLLSGRYEKPVVLKYNLEIPPYLTAQYEPRMHIPEQDDVGKWYPKDGEPKVSIKCLKLYLNIT